MNAYVLYIFCVLVWGTTWYAIKLQLGEVDPGVSVGYRFFLAGLILSAFCWIRGVSLKVNWQVFRYFIGIAFVLYGFNYLLTYMSTEHLSSGVVALVFSLLPVFNILNFKLLFGSKMQPVVLLGSLLGVAGLGLVFRNELGGLNLDPAVLEGFILIGLGTYIASFGNMLLHVLSIKKVSILVTNSYGMTMGGLVILTWSLLTGSALSFEWTWTYAGSLVYLSVFGSILAFGSYLAVIKRLGADRAAYAAVVFPVVALFISSFLESFVWNAWSIAGVAMTIAGNIVVLRSKKPVVKDKDSAAAEISRIYSSKKKIKKAA